jgi:competence transcription factor ComK
MRHHAESFKDIVASCQYKLKARIERSNTWPNLLGAEKTNVFYDIMNIQVKLPLFISPTKCTFL